jgi:lipopolysaccharide exporter
VRARLSAIRRPRLPVVGTVARHIAVVGGATALGQGAIVVAAPVLARLYDPDAFGLLAVYSALLSVLLAGSSLRYDVAITIAADPDEALHLLVVSIFVALATSIVLGFVVLESGAQLSAVLGAPSLAALLWLLPIALFVSSVVQALASWAVYHRLFPALARMRVLQGLTQAACQTALGIISSGPLGLIAGDVMGRVVGADRLLRPLFSVARSTNLGLRTMGVYARKRWGFVQVMVAASLLNALSLQVPFLMIPAFFDLQSSGQYFLAYRLLVLPASLVAAAVSQVFFGEASYRRADPRALHALAKNAAVSLLVFSIPTYGIVAVGGPALIEAVFGQRWGPAGLYAQVMAPWLMVWSVASPISTLLLVGRRERESLAFTAGELGLRAGSLGIGVMTHSLILGIVVLSMVSVLINVAALWRFLRVASVSLWELIRPAGRIIALTIPFLGCIALTGSVLPAAVPVVSAVGWALALGLAARLSPEVRALTSEHD